MAEKEGRVVDKGLGEEYSSKRPLNPLFWILSKAKVKVVSFRFPPPPAKKKDDGKSADSKPVTVSFPDTHLAAVPPLKLQSEELQRDTNPVFLWQVYAIGGFFILRWALARWNERRANKKSSDEDSPPPPAAAAESNE